MDYENPLDHLIHRFQHRWETNAQFRAAMSGVLGLSLIIFLCIGVAGVNAGATRVLAAVGFGASGGNQVNIDPGGQIVNGSWTFYTPTVPAWNGGATPGSNPIPNSQTPQASPTPTATPPDAPTATPCRSNCGGGGNKGKITATYSPGTWTNGDTTRSITFTASSPNADMNIIISYPGVTILSASETPVCPATPYCVPRNSGPTGTITWVLGLRPQGLFCSAGTHINVTYSANLGGQVYGPTLSIPCG